MNWDADYELIMRDIGLEPYGCAAEGCTHIARSIIGVVLHQLFGRHPNPDRLKES